MEVEAQTKLLGNALLGSPLWDDHISVPARWLFICLLLRSDDRGEITVDEDYRVCAEISGLGIQSSQRALVELEKAKMITAFDDDTVVVHRVGEYRHRQTKAQAQSADRMRRMRKRNRDATQSVTDPVTVYAPPPVPPPDRVQTSTSSTSSTSTVLEGSSEPETKETAKEQQARIRKETGFDEFWDAYGKKTSTKKALSAWKRLSKKDRAAAMACVPAYVAATPDIQYRKSPTTWINQRCWEDEMVAPHKQPKREHLPEAGEIDF